jgi:hypothetical protein
MKSFSHFFFVWEIEGSLATYSELLPSFGYKLDSFVKALEFFGLDLWDNWSRTG